MARLFYHVMQDNLGNLLFNVSGTMRLAGTGTPATIYGDKALTVPIANPMTNHPSFGSFKCFLGAGDYDFYMAKAGYTFETLTGVQGLGTMADQNANAVAITGGTINGAQITGGAINAMDFLSVNTGIVANQRIRVGYNKSAEFGMVIRVLAGDTGPGAAINFHNAADSKVGGIDTNATSTTYGTTSDVRLKHAITPLTGALDVVRALNPVSYLWNADGSPGRGLLAGEVQEVIPDGVITGERDAVDDDGRILPQMIDYSKLVPYLIGAVKELTGQVEMLQAQLAVVGE